ncbi:MAG: hypothetical protein U9R75_11175 [Candidatus Thermoplasmatota archaeon]|nr:hypothetical protein [Candidatus Thermoplasmatota archaeon]
MKSYAFSSMMILLSLASSMIALPDIAAEEHSSVLSLDFESDDGSLVHGGDGDLWEWGLPGTGTAEDPGPTSAGSGLKVWGCPLNGTYGVNTEAYLEVLEVDSSGFEELTLSFLYWMDLLPHDDELNETGEAHEGDEMVVQVSSDGVSWLDIEFMNGTTSGSWNTKEMDLSSHIDGDLHLRFLLRENGDGYVDNGVFLDLVELSGRQRGLVDITLSPGSMIPSVVTTGEKAKVLLEARNDGQSVPEGSSMTLYIETAAEKEEFFGSIDIAVSPMTTGTMDWYPSRSGNFRGWINLSIGGSYQEGISFNIKAFDPVFFDDASSSIDHWNVGGLPTSVEWDTIDTGERVPTMSSGPVFWGGGQNSGPNGTPGFEGDVEKYLESDWIDLRLISSSSLHFYHSYDLEGGFGASGGVVQALDDDGDWVILDPVKGDYGRLSNDLSTSLAGEKAFMGTHRWYAEEFDLDGFTGSRTRIRLTLVSGEQGYGGGWFIDDIMVSGQGYDPFDEEPPAKIEGLEVLVVDEGAVSLEWYPSIVQDFGSYNIYLEEDEFQDVDGLDPYEVLDMSDLDSLILTGLEPMRTYWAAVTAVDLNGNEDTSVVPIYFQPTEEDLNGMPVAVIDVEGGFFTRTVGDDVVLDGSGSYDPDGDPLTYIWTLPDGKVRRGCTITWRSDMVGDDLVVVLQVNDGHGKSSKDNISLSFMEDDVNGESGQDLLPFLIFITPFSIIVLLLVLFFVFVGKGRRKNLESRLRKVGLEMDGDGRLISTSRSGHEGDVVSRTRVLDVVPVRSDRKKAPDLEKLSPVPEWESKKRGPDKKALFDEDAPVKVVLECPYCGNSFKMSVSGSVISSGSPFDIECPHCKGKGKITP